MRNDHSGPRFSLGLRSTWRELPWWVRLFAYAQVLLVVVCFRFWV